MIEKASGKILSYLIKSEVISDDKYSQEYYQYGIEILISSLLNVLIILTIGMIMNNIIESILFLSCFIPLKQFTGGFHAKTYFRCYFIFGSIFLSLLIITNLSSCSKNIDENKISEHIKDNLDIKNGIYKSLEDESYVEITDGKYFQLINWDENKLEDLRKFYAQYGYENIERMSNGKLSEDELAEIRKRCDNSNQIKDDLVNNKAEFIINKADDSVSKMMIDEIGTDTEITYKLDDYELWFPFNYYYLNDEYKLISQQFGLEFYLEK